MKNLKLRKTETPPKKIFSRLVRPARLKSVAHRVNVKAIRKHSK